jgi:hypothetical protein
MVVMWLAENWKMIVFLLNTFFIIAVWAMRNTFAKKDDVIHLEKCVTALELTVKSMPNTTELHNVELQMREIQGEFDGVKKLLARVSYQLDMLVENELKGANK